jgi:hypothetical protein
LYISLRSNLKAEVEFLASLGETCGVICFSSRLWIDSVGILSGEGREGDKMELLGTKEECGAYEGGGGGMEDWNDNAGWIRTFRAWKGGLVPDWRF